MVDPFLDIHRPFPENECPDAATVTSSCDEWPTGIFSTEYLWNDRRTFTTNLKAPAIDALDPQSDNQIILHMKATVTHNCVDPGAAGSGNPTAMNGHHATLGIDSISLENASFGETLPFEP